VLEVLEACSSKASAFGPKVGFSHSRPPMLEVPSSNASVRRPKVGFSHSRPPMLEDGSSKKPADARCSTYQR